MTSVNNTSRRRLKFIAYLRIDEMMRRASADRALVLQVGWSSIAVQSPLGGGQ
jgi:hypothetical protein